MRVETQLTSGYIFGNKRTQNDGKAGAFQSIIDGIKQQECPYANRARDGFIQYNGVTFCCDYEKNCITLGDVSGSSRDVLDISLPSGGSLKVNVHNLGELSKAISMFSPEDINAILTAIETYRHCTSKLNEIEDELSKAPDEIAKEE